MRCISLSSATDLDAWREAARPLILSGVEPAQVQFRDGVTQGSLFDAGDAVPLPSGPPLTLTVPRAFLGLARDVALHRSEDRFDLLYRLLWRLQSDRSLLSVVSDVDVADALERAKNVSRASHKMKAFVRFRQAHDDQGEHWVAWFEPAHRVVERTAPFFMRRYTHMRWSILTPDGSAHWDLKDLRLGPAATRDQAPAEDEVEEFWRTYYASTFNPARLKPQMMQSEMPRRYWANLPEAALIPQLMAQAEQRARGMIEAGPTPVNARLAGAVAPAVARPGMDAVAPDTVAQLAKAAQGCRRCPLWRDATQAVCGQGPAGAELMIVGEQPGDQEDLAGQPFIGPAGQVLDTALAKAGINRSEAWVTNAVKHFKHEPRGKRRLHKTPSVGEVQACRWWLDHERRLIQPRLIIALGATAARSVLGRPVVLGQERGRLLPQADGSTVLVTIHPAYLLRLPDAAAAHDERTRFVQDLSLAVRATVSAG